MLESFETTFTHHTALVNGIRLHYSLGDRLVGMMQQVAEDVRGGAVERCRHFIPDEQPKYLVDQLLAFFRED